MTSTLVKKWFGERFNELSPELQQLHTDGGVLTGTININYGRGIAKFVGKRLAKKLGLPKHDKPNLRVSIKHDDTALIWLRCFDDSITMTSRFVPVGTIENGYWEESTGPLKMRLTVDIINGGWYWRCLEFRFLGVALAPWLFPSSKAYKYTDTNGYNFGVEFVSPMLGLLVGYSGSLNYSTNPIAQQLTLTQTACKHSQ